MDEKNLNKLPKEEQKLYKNAHPYCEGIQQYFAIYSAQPHSRNNVKSESKQSVNEWKHQMLINKISSMLRLKRKNQRRKICIQLIGPFPDDPYGRKVFGNLYKNIRDFVMLFFPGVEVVFAEQVYDHRQLKIKTRCHQVTKQTQLYLPGRQGICLASLTIIFPIYFINPFVPNAPFPLSLLKISENRKVFCF